MTSRFGSPKLIARTCCAEDVQVCGWRTPLREPTTPSAIGCRLSAVGTRLSALGCGWTTSRSSANSRQCCPGAAESVERARKHQPCRRLPGYCEVGVPRSTTTAQGACRTTCSAVDPINIRFSPVRPWVDITIRSHSWSLANSQIDIAGWPHATCRNTLLSPIGGQSQVKAESCC